MRKITALEFATEHMKFITGVVGNNIFIIDRGLGAIEVRSTGSGNAADACATTSYWLYEEDEMKELLNIGATP